MFTDGSTIATGTVLKTQVCVVGSGPAGVTVAWNLQKAGIDVILLEGARDVGTDPGYEQELWDDKTALYNGESVGLFTNVNEPSFLVRLNNQYPSGPSERERAFGGTSTHWGGQSRPLDEVALAGRGANYPAWPITRADLDPWYAAAIPFCSLYDSFDAAYWAKILNAQVPVVKDFETCMYQFIGPNFLNFATRQFPEGSTISGSGTISGSNAHVIINATLLDINHSGGAVQSLSCSSMTADQKPDTQFTVVADRYVLALGAVANARQLLIAKVPNDNIGRYFMCHPLVQSYMDGKPNPITISKPFLSPQQRQLLSGHTSLDPNSGWTGKNGVTVNGRFSPSADLQKSKQIGSIWFWGDSSQGLYFEQAPNKNSRVTLSVNKDKVWEQPQTHIDWQFCDADESTYTQNIEAYQKSAQLLNPATQIKGAPWKDIKSRVVVNGHHLGTTRMSETAADGVVDKNLRSHDLNNLYVAGSSVWRTACIPNPTFSIITFSLRLADHLKQSLKQGNAAKPELDSIAAD